MLRLLLIPLLALTLAACETTPDPPPLTAEEAAARDSVIQLIEAASRDALDEAFARLATTEHTVRERLEQFDERGRVNAFRRRTVEVRDGETETVFREAEGTFDFGAFGRFVSFDDLDRLPENPVPFLGPDDPPYLSPQGREAYRFAFAPDTLLAGRTARVITIRAREGEDGLALRSARLYVDAASGDLVGVRIRRHSQHVLFGETSSLVLLLAPAPDGAWLPELTDYRVSLRAALTATRRFQLVREYRPEAPAGRSVS
jgi:hypothetical protein